MGLDGPAGMLRNVSRAGIIECERDGVKKGWGKWAMWTIAALIV